jgi:flavin reductase (DIM6/NTAB) family NADH-FMN oxidoreductase RutF
MDTKALHLISYGLYIVGSKKGDKINGQTANTVIQVSSEPPLISVCIIEDSGVFTASIIAQDSPLSLVGGFGFKSGRDVDKFKSINHKLGETGAPVVLDDIIAYLEAKVINKVDVGTHTIFIGDLVGAEVLKEGEPMTYAYYHLVKRGTTPKTAPSFHED